MILETGKIKKAVDQVFEEISKAKFAFHCDWDDTVHTSFEKLIHDMDSYKSKMEEDLFKLSNLKNRISMLKDHVYFDNQINIQTAELGTIII